MTDIRGSKVLVIGGAGFIGSHVVDELLTEDVGQVIVYDNFCRGSRENLEEALKDPRVKIYEIGGDILQTDILNAAMKSCDQHRSASRRSQATPGAGWAPSATTE